MHKKLLLGDEAIAQAALDAGLSGVYSYPGTPSTEITMYIQQQTAGSSIHSRWCANEKTAMEAALGLSYAGKRALCCMKHVGLNVAADCFMNIAMSGINGGMIVVTADDPSMHSSQNEQDNRIYGDFAMLPMFEPSNQQEAYDMTYEGFELSEKFGYPILMRITTRMAHSRTGVVTREQQPQNDLHFLPDGRKRFVLLPALARQRFKVLLEAQTLFLQASQASAYNRYFDGPNRKRGIITAGIAFNYLSEYYPDGFEHPVLKICQYPLPVSHLEKITSECDEIFVFEDGYPFIEKLLRGYLNKGLTIHGRMDGTVRRDGELTPQAVAIALGTTSEPYYTIPALVAPRPPLLCQGCGHRDLFEALKEVVVSYPLAKVFSDIGCYTLGVLPPFSAIDTCIDMGASITMAKGASDAGVFPAIAVIGDSTFTHSGITGLLDCVNDDTNVTIIISDNHTTAMTGGQDSSGTGRLEAICKGIGVSPEHLRTIVPLKKNHEVMTTMLREEISYKGVSVIIPSRECIQTLKRKKRWEQ